MQLNIYLLSHPVIQKLANEVDNHYQISRKEYDENNKKLGLLIIYETIRKWINIKNIYIKQIDHFKKFCILGEYENYLIITDLIENYNIVSDISILLPEANIQHTSLNYLEKNFNFNIKYNTILNKGVKNVQKIIILKKSLDNYLIIYLLDYLILIRQHPINQIKIVCLTCQQRILERINEKHPEIQIYTTQIKKH